MAIAINKELLKLAQQRVGVKLAFVPSDAAVQSGGPPPGGPSPGGAAPPPGGMPPPPAAGGGAPPGAPPMPGPPPMMPGAAGSELDAKVQQAVQQAMQAVGGGGQGGAPGAGMKPPKPDINTVATDLFQLKKMIFADMRTRGVEPPPDILDGPNRDPVTGAPTASPTGGSDVPASPKMQPGSISPIEPMQGAMPTPMPGGQDKQGSAIDDVGLLKLASDVLRLYSCLRDGVEKQAKAKAGLVGIHDRLVESFKEAGVQAQPEEKLAADDKKIYGTSEGPGEEYPAPVKKIQHKAAALVGIFQRKNAKVK